MQRPRRILRLRRTVSPYDKDDVRYYPTVEEDIERANQMTLDQMKSLYSEYLGAQHGEVAVVGDFDAEECLEALQKIFADWTASKSYARLPKKNFPQVKWDKFHIDILSAHFVQRFDQRSGSPIEAVRNFEIAIRIVKNRINDIIGKKAALKVKNHVFIFDATIAGQMRMVTFWWTELPAEKALFGRGEFQLSCP